jgi:hypothetical protein
MAMVTFAVDTLPRRNGAAPVFLPDDDSPAVVVPGAAGELIELTEAAHA